jgi:hypothetical protein
MYPPEFAEVRDVSWYLTDEPPSIEDRPGERQKVGEWIREMTDAIPSEDGSYYLPYQPHATTAQFRAAYPDADKYFAVKQDVDPGNRFRNKLWEKYYPTKQARIREYLGSLDGYYKGEEQTFLTLPEWYLVFNPNEYADFLEHGNNPSDFPFYKSIDEYWTLYDRVNVLVGGLYPENALGHRRPRRSRNILRSLIGCFTSMTRSASANTRPVDMELYSLYSTLNCLGEVLPCQRPPAPASKKHVIGYRSCWTPRNVDRRP